MLTPCFCKKILERSQKGQKRGRSVDKIKMIINALLAKR
jgi:hypothetical protein